MKHLTQKYCLVSLLETVEVGSVFSWKDWALHVTFAGVHFAVWDDVMINEFERLIISIKKFQAKTLERGKLGIGETAIEVVFIESNTEVRHLHNSVLDFLDSNNAVFNSPEWNREGYVPHSTIQKHAQVSENYNLPIDNIALIDMFPDGYGYMRKIIKIFELK